MAPLRSTLLALLCAATWPMTASSETSLTRLGEFKVNQTTDGDQKRPLVAADFDGNFVVVWTADDGDGTGIFAQKYLQDGTPYNNEFQVNTSSFSDQSEPSVGKAGDGYFVVVWQSKDSPPESRIRAQLFFNDAFPDGDEFPIDPSAPSGANDQFPSVAMNDSGAFVVAWTRFGNAQPSIYFQRYDVEGFPVGGPTLAMAGDIAREEPSVAINAAGEFVIVWRQTGFDNTRDIQGRIFNADGTPKQPNTFEVSPSDDPNVHDYGSVAMADDGSFVVAWNAGPSSLDPNAFGIRAQRFDANAVKLGSAIPVNNTTEGGQVDPSVAIDPTGGFGVVWTSSTGDNNGSAVFARLFAADGTPQDTEFLANTFTTGAQTANRTEGAIAFDSNGNFVIVWDSPAIDGSSLGIVADKFYRPNQGPSLVEFRVNATTPGNQNAPAVATATDGRSVVVWKSDSSFAGGPGIYGQRIDALGRRVGAEFKVDLASIMTGNPRVAMDANANFVVAWTGGSTTSHTVYARLFDWAGQNNSPPLTVEGVDLANEKFVDGVAMTPNGEFAVGWTVFNSVSSAFQPYLRFYNAAGTAVQPSTLIDSNADAVVPKANPAGGYAVTYIKTPAPNTRDIYLRTYDNAGASKAGPFLVDGLSDGIQENATSAFAPNGSLFVVWEHRELPGIPGIDDIYVQEINVDTGAKGIGPFRINKTAEGDQSEPSISFALNGDFFVTYRSDNIDFDGKGIAIERITPSSLPTLPEEFFLNPFTQGNQSPSGDPSGIVCQNIAGDGFGNYIAVWTSDAQDGSGSGIYGTKVFISTEPYAETNDATNITSFSATLNGRVIPHDVTVVVTFEIAENESDLGTANATFIEATPFVVEGGSDTPQAVSAEVTGLTLGPNGTDKAYFFRTRVDTEVNTIYGEPAVFATFNSAPTAVSDTFFVPGKSVTFKPQLNDIDIDQSSAGLTVEVLIPPAEVQGTLTIGKDGITFNAGSDFSDRTVFTYRVIDMFGQQSNEATVTLIRFAAVAGKYEGLVSGPAGTGSFSIMINRTAGSFTGLLLFEGDRIPLDGRFEPDGTLVAEVSGTIYKLALKLNDQGEVTGELRDTSETVVAVVGLDIVNGGGDPNAVDSGTYTTFLEVPEEDVVEVTPLSAFGPRGGAAEGVRPGGFGFFLATVKKGTLNGRFVGMLPDGSKTSAGSGLSKKKRYVISKSLYKSGKRFGGSIIGQPSFGSSRNRISANLNWSKDPRPKDVFFPQGFTNLQVLVAALRFTKQAQPITFPQNISPNALLNFSRGGFGTTPFVALNVSRQNRVVIQSDPNNLQPKVTIPRFSPFFRGTFVHPVTNKRVKFSGIFKQKQLPSDQSEGRALFRTKEPDGEGGTRGVTGRVTLSPL